MLNAEGKNAEATTSQYHKVGLGVKECDFVSEESLSPPGGSEVVPK